MFSFRIKRTVITVDIGFLAVIAVISINSGKFSGVSFASCMIHEAGHLAAILITGVNVRRISFTLTGIRIKRSAEKICSDFTDIIILLCGPMASLTASVLCYFFAENSYAFSVNLILGIFNLLPFSALDGGSAAELIFERCNIKAGAVCVLRFFNITANVLLIIYFAVHGIRNISVYIMCIFLGFTELKKLFEVID